MRAAAVRLSSLMMGQTYSTVPVTGSPLSPARTLAISPARTLAKSRDETVAAIHTVERSAMTIWVALYGVSVMQIQVLHGARRTSIQGAISIAALWGAFNQEETRSANPAYILRSPNELQSLLRQWD